MKEIYSARVIITNGKGEVTVDNYPVVVIDGKPFIDQMKMDNILRNAKIPEKDRANYKVKQIILLIKLGL